MNTELKIKVGILGATGSVGQKFISLLENHPWFEITEITASEKSAGKKYKETVNWVLSNPIPKSISEKIIKKCKPNLDCKIVFSGLDSSVAGEIEKDFAQNGYIVISNSRNHRMDKDVPLLIPEVNPDHLNIINNQKYNGGVIVTNPNCSTIGLTMALKPLMDNFGIESLNVVTMQAISGGGISLMQSDSYIDNVIPFISGEEDKMETEPLKILGNFNSDKIENADFPISAQCNRVNVFDGHTECVQVKLKKKVSSEKIIKAWQNFKAEPQFLDLPSAPVNPIHYFVDENLPQPKLQKDIDKGMAVSIGRLREDKLFDYKFVVLSHNTIRGAAGGSILCAELMYAQSLIK
ncbi:MAG: aspartate-semialdehyde dehydrogenase [Bacteroidetes bacterium]|nr:aspartate-semialdehyde dehydrogenase [Bacteroidota bacterium]MCH8325961.1 aspartate-semialdehyde dehydrogenase [Bacteroidota bacterium]